MCSRVILTCLIPVHRHEPIRLILVPSKERIWGPQFCTEVLKLHCCWIVRMQGADHSGFLEPPLFTNCCERISTF